jgi:hypothetical protein
MTDYKEVNLNINSIIDNLEPKTFESLRNVLLKDYNDIYIKESNDSNLVMISNSFLKKKLSYDDIYSECRSIVFDKDKLTVVCYTYDDIIYNDEARNFILEHDTYERVIYECFEGTLISLYYYNDQWNMSTRRCLNSKLSKWQSNKSYYELFLECVNSSFDEFTSHLSKSNNYFFVLVHHENKNIVDYTKLLGENYKEIVHVITRDQQTHHEFALDDESQWEKKINIRQPTIHNDFSILDNDNKTEKLSLPISNEGLLVKMYNKENGKSYFLKIQTNSYQFVTLLKPNNNNILVSFIELYQKNLLKEHIEFFPGNDMVTDYLTNMKYDTIGMIDASFKVLTSELFELFRHSYNFKDCKHKNQKTYHCLPNEYKTALFKIRGIYYTKKEKYIKEKASNSINGNVKLANSNSSLRIADIYDELKKYDIRELVKLFKARRNIQLKCQANTDPEYTTIFTGFSHRCDDISLKIIYILLNNMFRREGTQIIKIDDNAQQFSMTAI